MRREIQLFSAIAACLAGVCLFATDCFAASGTSAGSQSARWTLDIDINGRKFSYRIPEDIAAIDALPAAARQAAQAQMSRIEANQHVVRIVSNNFESARIARNRRLTPDYELRLLEVAISVPYSAVSQPNPLARILPTLKALPDYSKIHVVLPPPAEKRVRSQLAAAGLLGRAVLHPLEDWNQPKQRVSKYARASRWIRDTFMVGEDSDHQSVAFVPLAYSQFDDLADSDLDFVHEKWFDPRLALRFPAFIRGGNVAVADSADGKRAAFIGAREAQLNRDIYKYSTATIPPEGSVRAIIGQIAGVENVHVLPNTDRLPHIDMSIAFLGPGVVAMIDPIDMQLLAAEDRVALDSIRREVLASGFRVVPIPTTSDRVNSFRSPVNIVPFLNKRTGRMEALVSRFPDRIVSIGEQAISLNESVRRAYEAAGIKVRWVDDRLSDLEGNVHCALLGLN